MVGRHAQCTKLRLAWLLSLMNALAQPRVELFKKDLEVRRQELISSLGSLEQESRSFDHSEPQDLGDRSNTTYTKEFVFQRRAQARRLLRLIEGALDRIDDGTFGQCTNCGREIGEKRLEAIPWTLYCRDCQEQFERTPSEGPGS